MTDWSKWRPLNIRNPPAKNRKGNATTSVTEKFATEPAEVVAVQFCSTKLGKIADAAHVNRCEGFSPSQ
jgi:hypothetical protein